MSGQEEARKAVEQLDPAFLAAYDRFAGVPARKAELEPKIEARARALEQHAQSLCTQVLALNQVQSALEFRYEGQPLRMMRVSGDDAPAPVAKEQAPDNGITLP